MSPTLVVTGGGGSDSELTTASVADTAEIKALVGAHTGVALITTGVVGTKMLARVKLEGGSDWRNERLEIIDWIRNPDPFLIHLLGTG